MAILPFLQPGPLTLTDFTDKVITTHWIAEGWGPIAVYSLILSVFVVALAYMIAEILQSPQLNAWAKSELFEFIVSALIIANLFFLLTFMNAFVYEVTGGYNHFDMGKMYIDKLVNAPSVTNYASGASFMGDITKSYVLFIGLDAFVGFAGSFFTQFAISEYGIINTKIGFAPYSGLSQLSPTLFTLTDMVGVVLMTMIAQKALLTFFEESMFSVFLPLGVVLRTFPISRKLGSTIIAIAITCYVVYPLTLLMNMGIYDSVPKEDTFPIMEEFQIEHAARVAANPACVPLGGVCVVDSDCCGVPCYEDNLGTRTCQIFPTSGLFTTADISDVGCAGTVDDHITPCLGPGDCPCGGICITHPDGNGYCGFPNLDQSDFLARINTLPSTCDPTLGKCWYVNNMDRAPGTRGFTNDLTDNLLLYLISPFHMPGFVFSVFEKWLPKLMWPVMASLVLAIIDIIICITFFKSISETIGGELSILGLTRAI